MILTQEQLDELGEKYSDNKDVQNLLSHIYETAIIMDEHIAAIWEQHDKLFIDHEEVRLKYFYMVESELFLKQRLQALSDAQESTISKLEHLDGYSRWLEHVVNRSARKHES